MSEIVRERVSRTNEGHVCGKREMSAKIATGSGGTGFAAFFFAADFFRAAEDFFPESGASDYERDATPRFFAASREEVFFAGRFEGFPAFPASPRRDDSDVSVSAALPLSPKMKCVPVSPNFSAAAKPIAASARTQTKTRNFFPPLDFFCGGVFRGAVFVGLLLIGIFRKKKRFS